MGMVFLKVVLVIAITTSLSVTLMMKRIGQEEEQTPSLNVNSSQARVVSSKRVSRFLADQERNHRAADHCHKDREVCYLQDVKNSATCCNNKCVDLSTDSHNCGACKNQCKYTETCCRGQCVNLAYDKRHCGHCKHQCDLGQFCVYELCNYA